MRVVHLVQGYSPAIGGTESVIQRLSEHLVADHNDSVTVITTAAMSGGAFVGLDPRRLPVGIEAINGVRVYRQPFFAGHAAISGLLQRAAYRFRLPLNDVLRTIWQGPVSPGMLRRVLTCEADVIAASSFPLLHMWYALWAGEVKRRPVVLIGGLHPDDQWGFDRGCIIQAIKQADAYVAYTTYERDYLIGKGISPSAITVIGAGVDPEPFLKADGAEIRWRFGWGDSPVVAFVGQHAEHKGIDTLISAMALVWQERPDTRLLIAGASTPFTPRLESLISALGPDVRTRVAFLTNIPEIEKAQVLAACDIFAHPSRYESFGIAFLEAWAAGKPVIGCRAGATPFVIADRRDGILVAPGSEAELAKAIVHLAGDAALRRRLGENGRAKVLANFTWSEVSREFHDLYARVVARSGKRSTA